MKRLILALVCCAPLVALADTTARLHWIGPVPQTAKPVASAFPS